MHYSTLEYTIFNILNYVPFIAIYFYAFRNYLRFSAKKTSCIVIGLVLAYLISNFFVQDVPDLYIHIFTYALMAISVFVALFLFTAGIGQMIFVAFFLKNCSDCILVMAKYIEYLFLPDNALNEYCISYSISMLLLEIIILPMVVYIIKMFFPPNSLDRTLASYWKTLWIVPLFFYILWIYIFYSPSDHSAMEIALNPSTNALMLFSICCQLFIYVCLASLVKKYEENLRIQEEMYASDMQSLQQKNIMQQINITKEHRHDFRHHLVTLSSLVKSQKYDELQDYIKKYLNITLDEEAIYFCDNGTLNNMLVFYATKCKNVGIAYDVNLNIPGVISLTDMEISILFGNLLENAYEACMKQDPAKCRIEIKGIMFNNSMVFQIGNTVPDDFEFTNSDAFVSTKHNGLGIGTQSCRRIVAKKNGTITWVNEDLFYAKFILPS